MFFTIQIVIVICISNKFLLYEKNNKFFRYGFLYTRFKENLYMWELIVMLRSVLFVMCLTFVDSYVGV